MGNIVAKAVITGAFIKCLFLAPTCYLQVINLQATVEQKAQEIQQPK